MQQKSIKSWFNNRYLVIATMHEKEKVIAPILETQLGVNIQVPKQFNTDEFGTFTRDIKRLGTQIEAARYKAQKALEMTGEKLAIASEGSFIPHPAFPFVSCDREIVLLLDLEHNLEIIALEISLETNHSHQKIKNVQEALEFAEKVGFPEHGLVVMLTANTTDKQHIYKGITEQSQLIEIVENALNESLNQTIHLETDMRAMVNPKRMKVIEKATQNLVKIIYQQCPECACPGFNIKESKPGLPCGLCSFPTESILLHIYHCQRCNFVEEKLFPNGIKTADPTYCQYCNP
ncbi:DUF6671 family protein [Crocosphaera sp. XPORK-15E]|uniref:DUF6671 family protein n=1 Tax=Crocosphaera sp. XPORK-15E TaxID=3110247 RepID=UPI002B1EAEB4|nr:DUF6671 family protein [Crocosphaera sp. XPORK-15E]MEA5535280.1 DUF6671 family protein [Crocosphaera sp. XPORK-15E]